MSYYLTAEAEDDEHVARLGAEVESVTYTTEVVDQRGEVVSSKVQTEPLVCSCGTMTCGAIRRYGLPRPVYATEIATLPPSQMVRDRRAIEIKGGM